MDGATVQACQVDTDELDLNLLDSNIVKDSNTIYRHNEVFMKN